MSPFRRCREKGRKAAQCFEKDIALFNTGD
jgi:hypothetical protein